MAIRSELKILLNFKSPNTPTTDIQDLPAEDTIVGVPSNSDLILRSLPDIVFLVDQDGICLESNDHPDLMIPRMQLLGRPISDGLPPEFSTHWHTALQQALRDSAEVSANYVVQRPDGPAEFKTRLRRVDKDKVVVLIQNVSGEAKARTEALEQRRLMEAIDNAQAQFILASDRRSAFDGLLSDLLSITESEYGFIAEVLHQSDGRPYIKTLAITDISWDVYAYLKARIFAATPD